MNKSQTSFDFSHFLRVAVTAAALIFFFIFSISFLLPNLSPYLAVLLLGIVFLGFPHGALDIFLLRSFHYKGLTPATALGLYIAIVLMMIGLWLVLPALSFVFFIAYSCFHFAQSDLHWKKEQPNFLTLEFWARFFIPFFIPFGLQSERSIELAQMIHPGLSLSSFTSAFTFLAYVGISLSVIIMLRGFYTSLRTEQEWDIQTLEPFVISIVFVFLDPLYGLGIYFCFIHSVKHIVNFLNSPVNVNLPALIPFWLIPIFVVIGFCYFYDPSGMKVEDSLFRWSIIILSSLALPHALLIHLSKSQGSIR